MLHRLPSTSSKPGCPCRNSRSVSQAASAESTDGGSADELSVCSSSSSSSAASALHVVDLAAMISSTMLSLTGHRTSERRHLRRRNLPWRCCYQSVGLTVVVGDLKPGVSVTVGDRLLCDATALSPWILGCAGQLSIMRATLRR